MVLPQSMCAYCAFASALGGVLFAHYIGYIVGCLSGPQRRRDGEKLNIGTSSVSVTSVRPLSAQQSSHRRSSLGALGKEQRRAAERQRAAAAKVRRFDPNTTDFDDDDDDDECHDELYPFEFLLDSTASSRQRFNPVTTAATCRTSKFRRRTSLPTIPFKFDKVSRCRLKYLSLS